MNKFEIGDKVVLINTTGLNEVHIQYGGMYNVLKVDGDFVTLTDDEKSFTEGVYDFRLTKVVLIEKETEMTAEQIRNEILRIDLRIEEAKKDIENAQNERNSLVEKLREKGFELSGTSNEHIKIGDRVEITGLDKLRHEKSYIGRKGIIEKIDDTHIPFKVILDGEDDSSNTWFEADQVKKI